MPDGRVAGANAPVFVERSRARPGTLDFESKVAGANAPKLR